jgi:hypothetical protein
MRNCIFILIEYTRECGYDESLSDLTSNRHVECDTMERCPINSYCNKLTNRCCVKGRIRMNAVFLLLKELYF